MALRAELEACAAPWDIEDISTSSCDPIYHRPEIYTIANFLARLDLVIDSI
jgi:hypothetical protein